MRSVRGVPRASLVLSVALSLCLCPKASAADATTAAPAAAKQASAFYPARLVARARENAKKHPWAAAIQRPIVEAAEPFRTISDEDLWRLMFGNTIKRSWMVWSNGHCPACQKGVPMYNWKVDALERPWKMRCPHCKELFPKNDFEKFYRSGLDQHGVFQPDRADRSLLFNAEHRDVADPLHKFGVDDGEGYVDGEKRWRFIGAYLIYGHWKQALVGGAAKLAAAYVVTGDRIYAHKAAVLLDRIADLYPTHDFGKQGVMYEGPPARGYVSTWHDACVEARDLALAYDQVFEAMQEDTELVAFLSAKARRHEIENPKRSIADIRRNIEERILLDTVRNRAKIESNYPQTDMAVTLLKTVLGWPQNREEVMGHIDGILSRATAVDGLSGEKGLTGYSVIAPRTVAELLGLYVRVEPDFLTEAFRRQPRLHEMYRFHIDTWCLEKYYPRSGDTGGFAKPTERYAPLPFTTNPGLEPSAYSFLWSVYELTRDADFVRVLYRANSNTAEGLPYDLLAENPEAFQAKVQEVIASEGNELRLSSVNKQQWCLAVLRSGEGANGRAVWLDYDSGGAHGHADGMTLGLFAKGLDLLPDFGYPPVHYGGWGAPRSVWYMRTAAHNSVVVDGKNTAAGSGKTTLWMDGRSCRAIRASAPAMISGQQYERTVAAIDVSDSNAYLVDIFRAVGGAEHVRFTHSHYGRLDTSGLSLPEAKPLEMPAQNLQMRSFRGGAEPAPGWHADWTVEDRQSLAPRGSEIHLRLTDFTPQAEVLTAQTWISMGFSGTEEAWIPSLITRRRSESAPLASTFVSVLEPYDRERFVRAIRRLPLETVDGSAYPDANVAVELELADGCRDLLIAADVENPLGARPSLKDDGILVQKALDVRFDGELCWVRRTADGQPVRVGICKGSELTTGPLTVQLEPGTESVEIAIDGRRAKLLAGSGESLVTVKLNGQEIWAKE
jgi:hypothetical protein